MNDAQDEYDETRKAVEENVRRFDAVFSALCFGMALLTFVLCIGGLIFDEDNMIDSSIALGILTSGLTFSHIYNMRRARRGI